MAKVTIRRTWGDDGDALAVVVEVEGSYPDAVNEAEQRALSTYATAHGVTLKAEADEGGDQ